MNLDELQSVRDRERQTDKPQQLRESFYEDVGAFVEQLRAERERAVERHDSHYADEVRQLTDEIETAHHLVEKLHERRTGKIVKAASLEAADLSPEVGGLTTEEQDLFETLVGDIETHRENVLTTVEGEDVTAATDEGTAREITDEGTTPAADVMGPAGTERATPDANGASEGTRPADPDAGGTGAEASNRVEMGSGRNGASDGSNASADSPAEPASRGTEAANGGGRPPGDAGTDGERGATETGRTNGVTGTRAEAGRGEGIERERVLITEDIDTFVGPDDRDYDLAADDVVTLPATNADLLVERDAARRL